MLPGVPWWGPPGFYAIVDMLLLILALHIITLFLSHYNLKKFYSPVIVC